MRIRITVHLFLATILNFFIETFASEEKANIKQVIMEKIGRGEKVNQGHINELADLESAKYAEKTFQHLLAVGWSAEEAMDKMKRWGLTPYGSLYDELRLHGSNDLEPHKEEIKDKIEKKQLAGKKITQRHFNKLAEQQTEKLRNQEYVNLLEDGYPSELATRLIQERGLMDGGEVYDKLRKPHINLETGSALPIDLTIRKRIIMREIEAKKRAGEEVTQDFRNMLAGKEARFLHNRLYHKMKDAGLDPTFAYTMLNDRFVYGWNEVEKELRKPPIFAEEQVPSKHKKRLQPGEGSSSGREHQSAGKRSASNI